MKIIYLWISSFTVFMCFNVPNYVLATDDIFITNHTLTSSKIIDYEDLDRLFSKNVFPVGRSEHIHASIGVAETGTRIRAGNIKASRLEGNRVFFHALSKENLNYISSIRERLETIPDHVNFAKLTKNQQLVYWLNLHNITVYEHIAKAYPIKHVRRLIIGKEKCTNFRCKDTSSLLLKPTITIKGHPISLQDIQEHIFTNWSEPLVIYGLFMGAVGTPNIRTEAYSADRIWQQLEDNAEEFVNSIRGTQIWGEKLHISDYYKRTAIMFPDFKTDIKKHLMKYADNGFKDRISNISVIIPKVNDWNIADFFEGNPGHASRYINFRTLPPHTNDFVENVVKRFRKLNPSVTVEEVEIESTDQTP